jgi:FkbM family methyltransferase
MRMPDRTPAPFTGQTSRFAARWRWPRLPRSRRPDRQGATAIPVGNNRLLVGTTIGGQRHAYFVQADDRLLTPWFALTGRYETAATAFLLRTLRPDSHCLDIGSNFGYFLCLMARRCVHGQVLAVEPDAEVAALAQDNLFLNGVHDHAAVIRAAVADRAGTLTLHRRSFRSGNTSLVAADRGFTDYLNEPPAQPFTVPTLTIDTLSERMGGRVDVVKIDVEGAEPLVLAGAAETIARNPAIVLLMEWSPGQMASAGYAIADVVRQIAALGLRPALLTEKDERPLDIDVLLNLPYQSSIILRRA